MVILTYWYYKARNIGYIRNGEHCVQKAF